MSRLFLLLSAAAVSSLASAQDGSAPAGPAPSPLAAPAVYNTYGAGCAGSGGHAGAVAPSANATTMGNYNNYYPFGRGNMRYHQVFDASDFTRPLLIQGLAVRQAATTTGRPGGVQTVEILLGTTTYTAATLTATYATNWTSGPPQSVFKGNINIPTLSGMNNDPTQWAMTIKFTKPFVYAPVPTANLLMEVQNTSAASVLQFFDAVNVATAPTARVFAISSSSAATGSVARSGLVICFIAPGTGGAVPSLSATGRPVLNTSLSIDLGRARANTVAALFFGFSRTQWGTFPLPLDLTPAGAPGCTLLASLDLSFGVAVDAQGNASVPLRVPNDRSLLNARWYNQYAIVDPVNALGWVFSNAGEAIVGDS